MTRPGVRLPVAGLATLALAAGLTACSSSASEEAQGAPARPAPVALDAVQAPDEVKVGVLVSLTSAPGEGSDWSKAAEGARVAAYRFGLGDVSVTLRPMDDKGTSKGAAAAVQRLASDGVSGIVVASEGDHVRAAVDAASKAGIPVLLPYETDAAGLPDHAWVTGPDRAQVASALTSALSDRGVSRPALVDAGGGKPDGMSPSASYRFHAGDDPTKLADAIAKQAGAGKGPDSVLVSGPAQLQATVVQALQGANVTLPVFLTPDALSPAFATTLAGLDGTLSGSLTTVGPDAGDVAAMGSGDDGQALSAYFAALRATAGDSKVTDFFDGQPFATVSDDADTRSHDAVVALVAAAAKAGSVDPADVADALAGLQVTHADGLAGPSLDFSSPDALADDEVAVLQASTQSPGLRPVAATPGPPAPQLFWFTAPSS
ncbi:ABC transporter substrate-binding protein [Nocardioides ungokensis]|uniref:ABC transporter substrate-binding protein n=1 Tax=Nocardioides ungokensis TaxID=1643322 RepID=UPI0015DEC6E0|nr:ABC transporter substrate-binding protein [Nocardioides ungokensis]